MLCVALYRSIGLNCRAFSLDPHPNDEVSIVSTFYDLMILLMAALAVDSLSFDRPKVQLDI